MIEQPVGAAIQPLQSHALVVVTDQLPQRRSVLQPGVGGQLAGGCGHAANHIAQGGGNLRWVKTQFSQLLLEAELADGRERGMLYPHATRPNLLQRA